MTATVWPVSSWLVVALKETPWACPWLVGLVTVAVAVTTAEAPPGPVIVTVMVSVPAWV